MPNYGKTNFQFFPLQKFKGERSPSPSLFPTKIFPNRKKRKYQKRRRKYISPFTGKKRKTRRNFHVFILAQQKNCCLVFFFLRDEFQVLKLLHFSTY